MLAARVPMLGIVIATLLLIAETVGAIAYRERAVAESAQAQVSEQMPNFHPGCGKSRHRVKHADGRPHKGE